MSAEQKITLDSTFDEIYGLNNGNAVISSSYTKQKSSGYIDNSVTYFSGSSSCKSDYTKEYVPTVGKKQSPIFIALAICIPVILLFYTILFDEYFSFWYTDFDKMFNNSKGSIKTLYSTWAKKYKERTFDKFVTKILLVASTIGIAYSYFMDYQYTCAIFIVIFTLNLCYYSFKKTVASIGIERMHYIKFRQSLE